MMKPTFSTSFLILLLIGLSNAQRNHRNCPPTWSPAPTETAVPSPSPSEEPTYSIEPSVSFEPTGSEFPSSVPTMRPSPIPTDSPAPSPSPSSAPSTSLFPSGSPSLLPSASLFPSSSPTFSPTISIEPSGGPSLEPSVSSYPSHHPSDMPSLSTHPSNTPTESPSSIPSDWPSLSPSDAPSSSMLPSSIPSDSPSTGPTSEPSDTPTQSARPSETHMPSIVPSSEPSKAPSDHPTSYPTGELRRYFADVSVSLPEIRERMAPMDTAIFETVVVRFLDDEFPTIEGLPIDFVYAQVTEQSIPVDSRKLAEGQEDLNVAFRIAADLRPAGNEPEMDFQWVIGTFLSMNTRDLLERLAEGSDFFLPTTVEESVNQQHGSRGEFNSERDSFFSTPVLIGLTSTAIAVMVVGSLYARSRRFDTLEHDSEYQCSNERSSKEYEYEYEYENDLSPSARENEDQKLTLESHEIFAFSQTRIDTDSPSMVPSLNRYRPNDDFSDIACSRGSNRLGTLSLNSSTSSSKLEGVSFLENSSTGDDSTRDSSSRANTGDYWYNQSSVTKVKPSTRSKIRNIFDQLEQVPEEPLSESSVTNSHIRRIQEETQRVKDKLMKSRCNDDRKAQHAGMSMDTGLSMEAILQASSSFESQVEGRIENIRSMEQLGVWGGTIVSVTETPKQEQPDASSSAERNNEHCDGEEFLLDTLSPRGEDETRQKRTLFSRWFKKSKEEKNSQQDDGSPQRVGALPNPAFRNAAARSDPSDGGSTLTRDTSSPNAVVISRTGRNHATHWNDSNKDNRSHRSRKSCYTATTPVWLNDETDNVMGYVGIRPREDDGGVPMGEELTIESFPKASATFSSDAYHSYYPPASQQPRRSKARPAKRRPVLELDVDSNENAVILGRESGGNFELQWGAQL